MLRYVREHWVAILLIVMFATATVFNFQQSGQVERNSQENDGRIGRAVNDATCRLRDATNEQLAAIEKLRAATGAALDVAVMSSAQPGASTDFRKLSQDVSNISIKPVEVPPDIVCDANEAVTSQERLDRP